MPIDSKPQIIKRVEALEGRYTDVGLNTQTFPISDAVDSERSDIAASSKAVKTTYDAATRYATTTQQGQVILTHDVESGAQDRALTPFGAKMALDELEKSVTDRLDELEASINERIEQIIQDLENKFNELNIKIEGKLPLFDSKQQLRPSGTSFPGSNVTQYTFPSSGSLWFWTAIGSQQVPNFGGDDPLTFALQKGCGFAKGGEKVMLPLGEITIWRVFP